MNKNVIITSLAILLPVCALAVDATNDVVRMAEDATVIVYTAIRGGVSQGSGFFINTNGLLLSNYHVIEGANKGYVSFRNGTKAPIRHVINYSAKYDIALLLVATNHPSTLAIADPETTHNGMLLHTMGAPNGLGWTHTTGSVEGVLFEREQGIQVLQHTAKIDHGSSGGPAFDEFGKIQTINTWGRPRKVQKSNGQYQLTWLDPRFQGAYCRDISRFLALPAKPQYLATLAAYQANHEVATWLLFVCSETDYVLRYMRDSILAMDKVRERTRDPSHRTIGGNARVVSDKIYWENVGHFNNSIKEFDNLREFVLTNMPLPSSTDPSLRQAWKHWITCVENINEAVDKMIQSQGSDTARFNRAYDSIKLDFIQANDFFYYTLRASLTGFQQYRNYSTLNSLVPPERLAYLARTYQNRGLELK